MMEAWSDFLNGIGVLTVFPFIAISRIGFYDN
jgi:hypothetical protein